MTSHQHKLKDRLPHTWQPFFARFGRFTEIQAQAIEPLLNGQNCIIVSATASGKTEAALAPLIERHKQRSQTELSILYIAPTRALTRDVARRLQRPLEQLAVPMQIKTGDEPSLKSDRRPELMITTPESFDSLLANRPRLAKDIRAVVLDEIHLYDNTARGDQLRILLSRLRRLKRYALDRGDIADDNLQFCALSATINDPSEVASRYFVDPVVIQVAGHREIDAEILPLESPDVLVQFLTTLQQRGKKKVLTFCTRRADCEQWAHLLRSASPFGNQVFVHHASLNARLRFATEKSFALAEAALCFATSTLELGIDIGDVDLIILHGPPNNTSAFLQRIGRGNRRTRRTSVVCFYRTPMERGLFQAFIRAARSGTIEPSDYYFCPSVIVQQLCSYIKQTRLGEIDPDHAHQLFVSPQGEPLLPKPEYDQIVKHLILKKYFLPSRGSALKPGTKWLELFEQRAIYTNLLDIQRSSVEVIDEMTGRRLGEIGWGASLGSTFLFGGQARQSAWRAGRKLFVRSSEDAEASAPRFRTPWRPLSPALARMVAAELGVPQPKSVYDIPMLIEDASEEQAKTGLQQFWLFHCAGDAFGVVLGDLLETLFPLKVMDTSGLYLMVEGTIPSTPLQFTGGQVRARVRRRWRQFESWFDLGRFQRQLPLEARRASVCEAFNVPEFLRSFNGRKLIGTS